MGSQRRLATRFADLCRAEQAANNLIGHIDMEDRALAALVREEVEREREANCNAIRAACEMCKGTGYSRAPSTNYVTREMATDAEAPEMEGQPVTDDGEECEYCGRPIKAIRARAADTEEA